MASSSQPLFRRHLLLIFLLVAALLPLSSCIDDDNNRVVLSCESTIVNDGSTIVDEAKNAIKFLEEKSDPTASIRYTYVTGLSWCRRDISATFCKSCRSIGAIKIRNECSPNTVAARFLFYDFCYLRIDLKNFIGEPDTSFGKVWSTMANGIKINKNDHWIQVDWLMNRVVIETIHNRMMFTEIPSKNDDQKLMITGRGLCSLDLSMIGCAKCLEKARVVIKIKCVFHTFCEVIYGSCALTYRTTRIKV